MNRNKSLVLSCVWKNPGVSRKKIAAILEMHPNLVSNAVRKLICEGWLTECETESIRPGRAPISLYLNLKKRLVISATYKQKELICVLVNPAGEIVKKIKVRHTFRGAKQLIELLSKTINRIKKTASGQLLGVGVADPGMIDSNKNEVIRSSTFPYWHHVPLAKLVEEKTGLPVRLEDNARAQAMAQYLSMPELRRKGASMLYINYGEGIGFALVTPDGIWRGSGFAGEVAHVIIKEKGDLCGCGARGCLESLVNPSALKDKIKAMLTSKVSSVLQGQKELNAEKIFRAALNGDRLAETAVKEIASYLALGIAFLASGFHPEYIVIGSKAEAAIQCLTREISSAVRSCVLPELASSVKIIPGKKSEFLTLTGAALIVFDKVITENHKIRKEPEER